MLDPRRIETNLQPEPIELLGMVHITITMILNQK